MYLKSLELNGFKSFAEKTKLEFDRGITAIVGPNGCGKSNIADAVRWVLGEQSARALRGTKMEDCIFNGTDTHKPLGMAEVSITLGDCESTLGTEYNEITVTRRVFRTGEGEYFINKVPCRLKDIHRLFMDTGIGTDAYAVMEQGKIDMILSARPEDRRAVFEEASGITKYKADKKEALRKLEHTEANLARLADIIREVRRQIISLQRQAGKARRYQALQERLRQLDIYATRERLAALDAEIQSLEARQKAAREREETLRAELQSMEREASQNRQALGEADQQITMLAESVMRQRAELERTRELIKINRERIAELEDLSSRYERDLSGAEQQLREQRAALEALEQEYSQALRCRAEAEQNLAQRQAQLEQKDREIEELRKKVHDLGCQAVDLESQLSHWQNELVRLDNEERSAVIRREKLAAEKAELQRQLTALAERLRAMDENLSRLREVEREQSHKLEKCATALRETRARRADLEARLRQLEVQIAAQSAQVELLQKRETLQRAFPPGAQAILENKSGVASLREQVLGSLAEHLRAEPPYDVALEAVLRAWWDALLVKDSAALRAALHTTSPAAIGTVRFLVANVPMNPPPAERGVPLLSRVQADPEVMPIVSHLLANVYCVDSLTDVPDPIPPEVVYVTKDGIVCRGCWAYEIWAREMAESNPLTLRHQLDDAMQTLRRLENERTAIETQVTETKGIEAQQEAEFEQLRSQLEEQRRSVSLHEGEKHVIDAEAQQLQQRAETVGWELELLTQQYGQGDQRRVDIRQQIEQGHARLAHIRSEVTALNEQLRFLERERVELAAAVSDARVGFAEVRQQVEHLASRKAPLESRIRELEQLVGDRTQGIQEYRNRVVEWQEEIRKAEEKLAPLEQSIQALQNELEERQAARVRVLDVVSGFDAALREKREALQQVQAERSELDVELAEQRVRRQNVLERVLTEYRITPEQLANEPAPEWETGQPPDRDTLETMIAEIRAKLDAMGPVNLIAIQEYQEHEQRYAFLTQQQEDLLKAKQQLMDLIRKINRTTTEMFSQTFQRVNECFQEMFRKLFGGGTAKLVLVNEEDVLESGIEIIARPPGKKLQNVSLLSGGEKTLTAVALLFALYMVKPSPFCLLDELDAALDEANIGRFTAVLKEFAQKSQFIVITHNRQTIAAADALYGVTMEEKGISKVVSMRFARKEAQPSGVTAPSSTAAPTATS